MSRKKQFAYLTPSEFLKLRRIYTLHFISAKLSVTEGDVRGNDTFDTFQYTMAKVVFKLTRVSWLALTCNIIGSLVQSHSLTFARYWVSVNNCPTRCNTKQSIYCSESSIYLIRVSNTPIIRSTRNCNYSLRYWSYFLCSLWTCRIINRLPCVASRWTIINIDRRWTEP